MADLKVRSFSGASDYLETSGAKLYVPNSNKDVAQRYGYVSPEQLLDSALELSDRGRTGGQDLHLLGAAHTHLMCQRIEARGNYVRAFPNAIDQAKDGAKNGSGTGGALVCGSA